MVQYAIAHFKPGIHPANHPGTGKCRRIFVIAQHLDFLRSAILNVTKRARMEVGLTGQAKRMHGFMRLRLCYLLLIEPSIVQGALEDECAWAWSAGLLFLFCKSSKSVCVAPSARCPSGLHQLKYRSLGRINTCEADQIRSAANNPHN